jgi:hypothetical protein
MAPLILSAAERLAEPRGAKIAVLGRPGVGKTKYLDPNDKTEATCNARKLEWRDFDGLRFLAEIGVEPGKDGYPDKNILVRAITKDRPEWGGHAPIDQGPSGGPAPSSGAAATAPAAGAPAATPAPITKPAWAQ